MNILLSIIVPVKTTNYIFLESIISKSSSIDCEQLELVIYDNSEDNEQINKILDKYNTTNIRYFHNKDAISVSENFDLAVGKSKGKYICILGADDIFNTKIIDVVKFLDMHEIESTIFNKVIYNWPDVEFRAHKDTPNLIIKNFSGKVTYIDVKQELKDQQKRGMTSIGNLPEPYHGIIKRSILDKVKQTSGSYFPGESPDMAVATALSIIVNKHIFLDLPIVISGHSKNSAGGKGAAGKHKGQLKQVPWLSNDVEKNWSSKIPKIWTAPTIYAQSATSAFELMQIKENMINFTYLYASFFIFYPSLYKHLTPFLKNKDVSLFKFLMYSLMIFSKRLRVFIKNYLFFKFNISKDLYFKQVLTSESASLIVDNLIKDIKIT